MNAWHRARTLTIVLLLACTHALAQDKEWTLEDIFASTTFSTKSLAAVQWMEGGKKFSYLETDSVTRLRNLYVYNIARNRRELLIDGSKLIPEGQDSAMRISNYKWSPGGRYVLITGTLAARRTKSGGNFGLYDVSRKSFRQMTDTDGDQAIIKVSPGDEQVGFVRSNNLFVIDIKSGEEKQLTFDGSENIINGKFDWVYEEEFSIIDGWEWSPDGKRIAFWRIDQTHVPEFPLVRYPVNDAHAKVEMMKYPKAGDANSIVRIGVVEVETGQITWMDIGENTDIYIPRIKWTTDPEVLSIQRLNRGQDTLELMLGNVLDGSTRIILTETDTAWIDIHDNLTFLERSDQFLWTSFRDGFTHIYLYNMDGSLVRQVTSGEWEVSRIAGVQESRRTIYFTATHASPLERHLYSIRYDGRDMRKLTREPGTHAINFSPDGLVYIDTYSAAGTPPQISLHSNDGARVARLVENRIEALTEYPYSPRRFFSFPTSYGERLNAWMIAPVNIDTTRPYPVLLAIYGGPGSQTVVDSWGGSTQLWYQMLAQKGYIIVSVDNRGTGARGKAFMQQTHRRLGLLETEDYIETARYLGSLPYVDSTRIGIWGWSGGGYMTCMALTLAADYFKAGIAVAPVTDFKFYDTIWTERYLDTPQNNPDGYRETSPITHAAKLKGDLLLIHGTTDDNVHWQNTIAFVDELVRHKKQVHTMFYPGRAHGISGASLHLFTLMTGFILEKL